MYLLSPSSFPVEKQSKEYLTSNPYWKVWHYPDNQITHTLQCFSADYSTNNFGMKDNSVDFDKPKIALIGDSYVEGYGVANEHTISANLESIFDYQIEVLNFGTSGGFGNAHAVSLYENFAREFDPDIVMVFFLSYNDLYDNLLAIEDGFVSQSFELIYSTADSSTVFNEVINFVEPELVENLPYGLYLPYFIKRGFGNIKSLLQISLNVKFEFSEIIGLPYYPDEPEIIYNGYKILESSLVRYQQLNTPNLILVNLPAPFQIDSNWKSIFETTHGVDLDIMKPNSRLKELTEKLEIEYFDPIDEAINYIDSTNMSYPYFYNECDKHFNQLGYKLMSDWLAEMLLSRRYITRSNEGNFTMNTKVNP